MTDRPESRSIDLTVELDAPPEAVWKALTDAEQLRSWFPLDAQVQPGEGGRILISWGDAPWESRISIWDPPRHLQLREPVEGEEGAPPVTVALDYHLESRGGGGTVLRLVHSGFSASDEWAEFLDSMESGWSYFLLNLKHYLAHHPGAVRRMVWRRLPVSGPSRSAMWPIVLRRLGVDAAAQPGDDVAIRLGSKTLRGNVLLSRPPSHFATTLPDLDNGLFFLELEPGGEKWKAGIWISTYGLPEQRVAELQNELDEAAAKIVETPTPV